MEAEAEEEQQEQEQEEGDDQQRGKRASPKQSRGHEGKIVRRLLACPTLTDGAFKGPVKRLFPGIWPGYRKVISRPMDLGTIKLRVDAGHYAGQAGHPNCGDGRSREERGREEQEEMEEREMEEQQQEQQEEQGAGSSHRPCGALVHPDFVRDVNQVWANAMVYNEDGAVYYNQALLMKAYFEQQLRECGDRAAATGGGGGGGGGNTWTKCQQHHYST